MSASAVTCSSLIKEFGDAGQILRVLHSLDVEFRTGELALLFGPSGCGKTTLISIIAGILSQTSGQVTLFGEDMAKLSTAQRTRHRLLNIGFVFQQSNLVHSLTAEQNVAIPLVAAGTSWQKALQRAREVLDSLGMLPRATHVPSKLSGGEQQRVSIGRALVHKPRLVICDEPTSALDAANGQKVLEMLKALAVNSNTSCIVVTHDARICSFANRIYHMEDGRIVSVTTSVEGTK